MKHSNAKTFSLFIATVVITALTATLAVADGHKSGSPQGDIIDVAVAAVLARWDGATRLLRNPVPFTTAERAEHGVGPHNRAYYEQYVLPDIERLHRSLKKELDPDRLLGHRFDD